jgi:hypothetical protein
LRDKSGTSVQALSCSEWYDDGRLRRNQRSSAAADMTLEEEGR